MRWNKNRLVVLAADDGFCTARRRRLRGLLRVVGLWSLCGSLGVALWARSAVAHLGESVSDIGQQMLAWYGGKTSDAPRRLTVNGLELSLQSAVTDATIREVFDQFAAQCRLRAGVIADKKPEKYLDYVTSKDWQNIQSGMVRRESADLGTIVCIDTERPLSPQEMLARIQRYTVTHDLADVGGLRALSARRTGNQTQVLIMASVGEMRLDRAFPKTGDAPGLEPAAVPRPPASRRILDTAEQGAGNALHVYESPGGSVEGVAAYYRSELHNRGWKVLDSSRKGVLLVEQGLRRTLVVVSASPDGTVKTSLIELSR